MMAAEQGCSSYAAVAERAFGARGFLIATVCNFLFCVLSMSFMLQIIGDVAPPLMDVEGFSGVYKEDPLDSSIHEDDDHVEDFQANDAHPPSDSERATSIFVAALIAFPFCLNYQLRSLRILASFTIAALAPLLFLVVLRTFVGVPAEEHGEGYGAGWVTPRNGLGLANGVGTLCFAATFQHQVFAVYACLRRRTVARFTQATRGAGATTFAILAFLGIMGYATFGRYLLPSLFAGYEVNDVASGGSDDEGGDGTDEGGDGTDDGILPPGLRRLSDSAEDAEMGWSNYIMRLLASVVVMTSFPANMLIARQAACQLGQRVEEICCPEGAADSANGRGSDAGHLSFSEAYMPRWDEAAGAAGGGVSGVFPRPEQRGRDLMSPTKIDVIADSLEEESRRRGRNSQSSLPHPPSSAATTTSPTSPPPDRTASPSPNNPNPNPLHDSSSGPGKPKAPSALDWIPPTQLMAGGAAVTMLDGGRSHSFGDESLQHLATAFDTDEAKGAMLSEPLMAQSPEMTFSDWSAALEAGVKADPELLERLTQGDSAGSISDMLNVASTPWPMRVHRFIVQTLRSVTREVRDWRRHRLHVAVTLLIYFLVLLITLFTLPSDLELYGEVVALVVAAALPAAIYFRLRVVADYSAVAWFGVLPNQLAMGAILAAAVASSVIFVAVHIVRWSESSA